MVLFNLFAFIVGAPDSLHPWLKQVIPHFEKKCHCSVELREIKGSFEAYLKKIEIRKKELPDILVGVDQFSFLRIESWVDSSGIDQPDVKLKYQPKNGFFPFDYGPLAFMATGLNTLPKNLNDLVKPEFQKKFALLDPRQSTPGLVFLLWAKHLGLGIDYLKNLKLHWFALFPSWSDAYAQFVEGRFALTWSYISSEAYHRKQNELQRAVVFSEGHPVQIEGFVFLKKSSSFPHKAQWLKQVWSHSAQFAIYENNWMYPVVDIEAPVSFKNLPQVKSVELQVTKETIDAALNEFDRVIYTF